GRHARGRVAADLHPGGLRRDARGVEGVESEDEADKDLRPSRDHQADLHARAAAASADGAAAVDRATLSLPDLEGVLADEADVLVFRLEHTEGSLLATVDRRADLLKRTV